MLYGVTSETTVFFSVSYMFLLQFGTIRAFDDGTGNIPVVWTPILCTHEHHVAIY